jgi:hypothetical protein
MVTAAAVRFFFAPPAISSTNRAWSWETVRVLLADLATTVDQQPQHVRIGVGHHLPQAVERDLANRAGLASLGG